MLELVKTDGLHVFSVRWKERGLVIFFFFKQKTAYEI